MTYIVTFTETIPSEGPSEVEYAEVLDNGWVRVQWRDFSDHYRYYPPHVVLTVQTPRDQELPEGEPPQEEP